MGGFLKEVLKGILSGGGHSGRKSSMESCMGASPKKILFYGLLYGNPLLNPLWESFMEILGGILYGDR